MPDLASGGIFYFQSPAVLRMFNIPSIPITCDPPWFSQSDGDYVLHKYSSDCIVDYGAIEGAPHRPKRAPAEPFAAPSNQPAPTPLARRRSLALLSWPQAARMSRPRGVRMGEA